jgi:hypothetical protein
MVPNGERQRAELGLREALDRLEDRINDATLGDPLIPFGEALNWSYSLEEWHKNQLKSMGVPDYYARRDSDPDGKIAAGVIYARGLVTHQLAQVSTLVDVYTDTYSDVYGDVRKWHWRTFSALPLPDKKETHGRDKKYEDHVEDQPMVEMMRAAERFLTSTVLSYYP